MNKALEIITKNLDPRNDMNRCTFDRNFFGVEVPGLGKALGTVKDALIGAGLGVKPLLRGGALGGLVVGGIGYLAGVDNPIDYVRIGAGYGGVLHADQYIMNWILHDQAAYESRQF